MKIIRFIKDNKIQVVFAVLTLALGFAVSLLSGGFSTYESLVLPPFAPPAFIFPIVWTVLYIMIGIAAGEVAVSNDLDKGYALKLYFVQLFINLLWPVIFFRLKAAKFALFWLVLLIIAALLTFKNFSNISKRAGLLFFPYLIWLFYAFYLNFGVIILNS